VVFHSFSAAKTRCPLLLVADYRFFREMGGGSTKTTINYLVLNQINLDLYMHNVIYWYVLISKDKFSGSCACAICCNYLARWE